MRIESDRSRVQLDFTEEQAELLRDCLSTQAEQNSGLRNKFLALHEASHGDIDDLKTLFTIGRSAGLDSDAVGAALELLTLIIVGSFSLCHILSPIRVTSPEVNKSHEVGSGMAVWEKVNSNGEVVMEPITTGPPWLVKLTVWACTSKLCSMC